MVVNSNESVTVIVICAVSVNKHMLSVTYRKMSYIPTESNVTVGSKTIDVVSPFPKSHKYESESEEKLSNSTSKGRQPKLSSIVNSALGIISKSNLKTIIAPHNVDEASLRQVELSFHKTVIRWSDLSQQKKEGERAARLEMALRANLQKRKKQTKLRNENDKSIEEKE